jgi:hypothetical protein
MEAMKKRFVGFLYLWLLLVCLVLSACDSFQPPDTEKPELILSGEASRLTTNPSVTLEGKLAPDVVKFVYRLNGGEPQDATASIRDGVFSLILENLPPGTNTVVFEATDGAGNVTVSDPITLVVVDLNGVWGNPNSLYELCGQSSDGNVLVLSLEQTPSGITGTVTTGFGGDYKKGTLTGAVSTENTLEAAVSFPSIIEGIPSATGTLTFEVEEGALTGLLSYQDGLTCSANDETPATTSVSSTLLKGVDVPPLPPDDALEPNDAQASATPVTLPYESPQELVFLRNNPDWYKLELTASAVITLLVTMPQEFSGLTLQLYDAQGAIEEKRFAYNVPKYGTVWGLGAGTYYLEVLGSPFYKVADMPYTFTLKAEATPDALFEPNDTVAQAFVIDTLPFDEQLYSQAGDEDWFRFRLLAASKVRFSKFPFAGMTLYSAKRDTATGKLVVNKVIAQDDFFFPLNLATGYYFLQVVESGTIGPYDLAFAIDTTPDPEPGQ